VWGTTIDEAAAGRVRAVASKGDLIQLTRTVERCLLADLPVASSELLDALAAKAALDSDVVHLMDALPALARAQRYGDVRQTDTTSLREVSEVLVKRVCAGLSRAVAGLDDDNATAMRGRIDAVASAVNLLGAGSTGGTGLVSLWHETLGALIDRMDVHGQLRGRMVRLLQDAERLDDVPVRLERALSHGAEAATKAAWVEGFFADGASLLIHDHDLRGLLDAWVRGLDEREFVDVLPVVRRTFGAFSPAERRSIAGRVGTAADRQRQEATEEVDEALAAPALATVRMIFGASGG
jgi:hypothetical protein